MTHNGLIRVHAPPRARARRGGVGKRDVRRPAAAQLRLDVTQGNVQPFPIAMPDFVGGTPGDVEAARGITQVITTNLRRSGLFPPIDPAAYIEKITNFDVVPRFPDWRAINAQGLVTGVVTRRATDGSK